LGVSNWLLEELEVFRLEKRGQSDLQTQKTAAAKWKGIIYSQ